MKVDHEGSDGGLEDERLEAELARLFEEFRVVDRGLLFDGRPMADLVAVVSGRPALVVTVDGNAADAMERAIAALSFARSMSGALRQHVGLDAPAGGPRVLLVAERPFDRELFERAAVLVGEDLWLLERHRLESERGESSLLLLVAPEGAASPPDSASEPRGEEATAQADAELDPALEALATDLAERLARLDPDVSCTESDDGLAWTLDGEPLCRLSVVDERMVGHLAGSEVPHRIASPADVDVFVDWVLSLHLAALERRDGGPLGSSLPTSGPLLTREEIEAFRD